MKKEIFSEQKGKILQNLSTIAEELEKQLENQQDDVKSKEIAIELVRKVKVLKLFDIIADEARGQKYILFKPLKLTFFPMDYGLDDMLPEEREEQIKIYTTELLSKLNKISKVIKFRKIGFERMEEFAYIKLPCICIIDWEI